MSTSEPTPREAVYDSQINPLMAQILAICKEHKIPMVASFGIGTAEDDPDYACTSLLVGDDYEPIPAGLMDARNALCSKPQFAAFTITTKPRT